MVCSECKKEIADSASICKYCGCKTENFSVNTDIDELVAGTPAKQIKIKHANDKKAKVVENDYNSYSDSSAKYAKSRKGVGFALGFFLSIIGIIISAFIFPKGSYSKKTCFKGAWSGFFSAIIIMILVSILNSVLITMFA